MDILLQGIAWLWLGVKLHHTYILYIIHTYSSVHGPRWCADSWDTMEHSERLPMQSLVKVQGSSGWIM